MVSLGQFGSRERVWVSDQVFDTSQLSGPLLVALEFGFKLNTYPAIKEGACGLSMVVRDGVGDVQISPALRKLANRLADMAEAQTLKFSMQYAFDDISFKM